MDRLYRRCAADFCGGADYTVFYVLAATRSRSGDGLLLHAVDIAAGAALLLLAARTSAILFSLAFYTSWIAWGRMTWRVRDVIPATVILSFCYLGAEAISGFSHDSLTDQQAVFSFYYLRGLYAVGFAYVLYRVSALELDTHLEQQRLRLRRRLHDDLGNTLCGLHYQIQCLEQTPVEKVSPTSRTAPAPPRNGCAAFSPFWTIRMRGSTMRRQPRRGGGLTGAPPLDRFNPPAKGNPKVSE